MYLLTLLTLLPLTAAFNSSTASPCLPLPPSTALSTIVFFNQTIVSETFLPPSASLPVAFFNQTLTSESSERGLLKARRVVPVDQRHLARFSAIRAPSRKFLAVPPKKTHTFHFGKEVPLIALVSIVVIFIISVCFFCALLHLWEELEYAMENYSQEMEEEEASEDEEDKEEEEFEEEEWEEAKESNC